MTDRRKPRRMKKIYKNRLILGIFQVSVSFLLKAVILSILGQNQHPGPFLETREQELSFDSLGFKIG